MSKKFTGLRFEEWIEKSLLENGYTHSFIHSNENEGKFSTGEGGVKIVA